MSKCDILYFLQTIQIRLGRLLTSRKGSTCHLVREKMFESKSRAEVGGFIASYRKRVYCS